MFFFIPNYLKQGWHQGEPINYDDDDDEIDDNDNNDYDHEGDDDDNNDGNGVFFSLQNHLFCRNLVFEALL